MKGDPARHPVPAAAMTDEQRAALIKLVCDNTDVGHITAARQVGISGSKGEIRKLLNADEQFQEALEERDRLLLAKYKLDHESLLQVTSDVVHNAESPSQWRAAQWVWGAFHGIAAKEQVEHTGPDGGPMEVENPDVAAAIERFTSAVVQLASRGEAEQAALDPPA